MAFDRKSQGGNPCPVPTTPSLLYLGIIDFFYPSCNNNKKLSLVGLLDERSYLISLIKERDVWAAERKIFKSGSKRSIILISAEKQDNVIDRALKAGL